VLAIGGWTKDSVGFGRSAARDHRRCASNLEIWPGIRGRVPTGTTSSLRRGTTRRIQRIGIARFSVVDSCRRRSRIPRSRENAPPLGSRWTEKVAKQLTDDYFAVKVGHHPSLNTKFLWQEGLIWLERYATVAFSSGDGSARQERPREPGRCQRFRAASPRTEFSRHESRRPGQ
jgi:hypothetical protein